VVGLREVEAYWVSVFDVFEAMELGAVVSGDCFETGGVPAHQAAETVGGFFRGSVVESSDVEVTGLPIDESEDAGLAGTDHGVDLPVSGARTIERSGWAGVDGALASQSAPAVIAPVALAALFTALP